MNDIVDSYDMGIVIVDVNFQSARPPEQVKDAFDDAIAAREDEERFEREAEAYRNDILPKATGRAERLKKEAQGYTERVVNEALGQVAQFEKLLPEYQAAPEVTRNRLYLDTMERVYSSTSKVLIDSESSGNLLYLPLINWRVKKVRLKTKRSTKSSSAYDQIELETQTSETTSDSFSFNWFTSREILRMRKLMIPVLVVTIVLLLMSVFVIQEGERGLVIRFGRVLDDNGVSRIYEPGLHFKMPLFDRVKTLDARIQTMDSRSDRFVTSEKKDVLIDTYVKWRISDFRSLLTNHWWWEYVDSGSAT